MFLLLVSVFWPEGWYGSYRTADHAEALELAGNLPDSAAGRNPSIALSMYYSGDDGSLELALAGVQEDSTDFRSWTALGAILTESDREGAEAAFRKAMELAPGDDPVLLESYAYYSLTVPDPDEAYRLASAALSVDPGFIPAVLTAAWALEDLGRLQEALQTLDRGIDQHPLGYSMMEEKAAVFGYLGMHDSALSVLEGVLLSNPDRLGTLRLIGSLHEEQGRLGHAVKAFRNVVSASPDDYWTWGQLGLLMEQLGRLETAGEYYSAGVQANPSYAWAYHRLGLLAEDPFRAVEFLEEAVAADSSFSQAWIDLGLACEDTGDLYRAAEAFRKSLEHNPSSWAWGELGWTLESVGDLSAAAEAYESGVSLDSSYTYGWQRRGALFREGGDDNAAMAWFGMAIEHIGDDPWMLGEMGNIRLMAGDVPGATGFFARAVQASPDYSFGLLNLARLYRQTGEHGSALRAIDGYLSSSAAEAEVGLVEKFFILSDSGSVVAADSVADLVPGSGAYTRYGWNALGLGFKDYAKRAADRAMTMGSTSPWDWIDLGGLYESLEDGQRAGECFLAASGLAGDDVEAHREVAGFFYRTGDYSGAGDRLAMALAFDSTASVLSELGEARLFEGRLQEAQEALLAALARDPSSVFTICYLGLLEERLGNPERAAQRYLDALRIMPGYSYAESRILYITGGDYDRSWHREKYSPLSWSLWADLSFSSGNQEESSISGGASIGLNYVRGSSLKLNGSMRLEERNGTRERESAYGSLTLEHFFTERLYAGISSSWDRQPLTVRPWQVSSYSAIGWKSWPAEWIWFAPEAGVGLVNTRWSVGEDRTDRVTSYASVGVWMRRPVHWLPHLWLAGSIYIPPGDARHTVSYGNTELDFDLPGPLSLLLGLNLDYTRTPAVDTWEKIDLDYYLRLRFGN